MSVSNRKKRAQASGFTQLVRTFAQRYDDPSSSERVSVPRGLPLGAAASFFAEQALWRAQRSLFGITLVEVKRLVEAARFEASELRQQMATLEAELAQLRAAGHPAA